MTRLVFDLHTCWHAGTGKGLGPVADAVVARTPGGLPYLPGRAVKGLLRHGMALAEACGRVDTGRTEALFGTRLAAARDLSDEEIDAQFEEARFHTTPGLLRFESASLGPDWEAWARGAPRPDPHRDALFVYLASTAVDDDGVVKDHTLRTIEAAIPLRLVAPVTCEGDSDDWVQDLRVAASLVRSLGAHRNRGLGRVTVTVEEA